MASNTYKEIQKNEKEPEEVKVKNKQKKSNPIFKGIQSVLDGTILTKNKVVRILPFLFYLAFLAIIYIANTYYSEKKIIDIEKIKKELKELRSESITTKSKLMFYSRQSEIIKRTEAYGIKESLTPPHKIYSKHDTTKKDK